jgi:hypothetical protein
MVKLPKGYLNYVTGHHKEEEEEKEEEKIKRRGSHIWRSHVKSLVKDGDCENRLL